MPSLRLPLYIVVLEMDGFFLAEALHFPEFSSLAETADGAVDDLLGQIQRMCHDEVGGVPLWQRLPTEPMTQIQQTIPIRTRSLPNGWCDQEQLSLSPIVRRIGGKKILAFIPEMGVEAVADSEEDLPFAVISEVFGALGRNYDMTALADLNRIQRVASVALHKRELHVSRLTALQEYRADIGPREKVIKDLCDDLTVGADFSILGRDQELRQIADSLLQRRPRSVLLVGEPGVGKTALVKGLVQRRVALGLRGRRFLESSGARLIAGETGFGVWQERLQKLIGELEGEKHLLYLGSLIELAGVGQGASQPQSMADYLRTPMDSGRLSVIVECTPAELQLLERQNAGLIRVFEQVVVTAPSEAEAAEIYRHYATFWGRLYKRELSPRGLELTAALHRRYAGYSKPPAPQLRFLRGLFRDGDAPLLEESHVYAAFSKTTGLPRFLLDASIKLSLTEARDFFRARVMGQEQAVAMVTDLTAAVKAKLGRPGRPTASFLLIGPTGVGKTETAKALARFFFSDATRMTRFDMSEYSNPVAVQMLVGGGASGEGRLTARVRETPFSVLLFDEVEKADASFFDLLLQILGDARLTDARGRTADFSNAIIIMTSNLGAEQYRKPRIGAHGEDTRIRGARKHFEEAVRRYLRPEIYNRIDRIVPFLPLGRAVVLEIAKRELDALRRRDGLVHRGLALTIDDAAVTLLAQEGYDPLYGARPLKRVIEQRVILPLSEGIKGLDGKYLMRAEVVVAEGRPAVHVEHILDQHGHRQPLHLVNANLAGPGLAAAGLRRRALRIKRMDTYHQVRNKLYRARQIKKTIARRRKRGNTFLSEDEALILKRLPHLEGLIEDVETHTQEVVDLEEGIALALLEKEAGDPLLWDQFLKDADNRQFALAQEILTASWDGPEQVFLALFTPHCETLHMLLESYLDAAKNNEMRVRAVAYRLGSPEGEAADTADHKAWRALQEKLDQSGRALYREELPLDGRELSLPSRTLGVGLTLQSRLAPLLTLMEGCLQRVQYMSSDVKVLVDNPGMAVDVYMPPLGLEGKELFKPKGTRLYQLREGVMSQASYRLKMDYFRQSHVGPVIHAFWWAQLKAKVQDLLSQGEASS